MEKGFFLGLVIMAVAVSAYGAPHKTIVETDTAFIVDYTDDARDKGAENVTEKTAPAVVREVVPASQPAVVAALPAERRKPAAAAPKHFAGKHVVPRQRRKGQWQRPEYIVDTPSSGSDE